MDDVGLPVDAVRGEIGRAGEDGDRLPLLLPHPAQNDILVVKDAAGDPCSFEGVGNVAQRRLIDDGLMVVGACMVDDAHPRSTLVRRFDRTGDLLQLILIDGDIDRPRRVHRPIEKVGDLLEQSVTQPFQRVWRQLVLAEPPLFSRLFHLPVDIAKGAREGLARRRRPSEVDNVASGGGLWLNGEGRSRLQPRLEW